MVILSAAVCTKSGKALVSRQFVEMTRIRIEGLLAAFPKLLGSDAKQHTYIETESVRYVYQPMDTLYLLLITNRASNIVEDLETLRLLSKVVPDIAGTSSNLNEDKISDKCFELIFAFDEVITAGGYKESITLQQIRTNLEMESHEEKLHNMIKISKMESAKDQARDAARVIRDKQRDQQRMGGSSSMAGIGSGSSGSNDFQYSSGGSTSSMSDNRLEVPSINSYSASSSSSSSSRTTAKVPAVKGMSLTGGKNKSLEDALVKEDRLAPVISGNASKGTSATSMSTDIQSVAQHVFQHPIMLVVAEAISAKLSRDGMVESLEIKGSLTLTATNDEAALCSVQLALGANEHFTFNTHPKINKQLYDRSGLLQLKDITKGFPSQRPVGILRWTHASTSDELVPLKINCWPEEESRGQMNVSIEYTMTQKIALHNVRIKIPLASNDAPSIVSIDGNFKHNASTQEIVWLIDLIDPSNATGSLEFNISQKSADAFFPISVSFVSQQLFCHVEVAKVTTSDLAHPIQYNISKSMSAEDYVIE